MAPAHAEGSGHTHLSLPLLRHHGEDVQDEEDARHHGEGAHQGEELAQLVHQVCEEVDGVPLDGFDDEGMALPQDGVEVLQGPVRRLVTIRHAANIGDRDEVDLARDVQGLLHSGQSKEDAIGGCPAPSAYVLDNVPHAHVQGLAVYEDLDDVPAFGVELTGQRLVDVDLVLLQGSPVHRAAVQKGKGAHVQGGVEGD